MAWRKRDDFSCDSSPGQSIIQGMKIRFRQIVLLLVIMSATGCASGRSNGGDVEPPDANLITKEQIRHHNFRNAYDAVQALHPNWLETKGVDSLRNPSQVLVYADNSRMGGIGELRFIPSESITYIRYYSGTEASSRWGLGHGSGVIFVSSHP
jgi:hypothetical protein